MSGQRYHKDIIIPASYSAAPIHWIGTLEFSLVAIAGSFAGAFLVSRIPVMMLRRLFAVFVLAVATFMIAREA